jgi:hypothetical protein
MKKQIKLTKLYRSRKGVSGVISGVFVILICFLALASIFVYAINLDRYNQVVNERHQIDWEIEKENYDIIMGQRNNDGTLNITVFNYGPVTAHLVDIWVTHKNQSGSWQKLYAVNYWLDSAETMTMIGFDNATELPSGTIVANISLPQAVDSAPGINYTIKLVSERGNIANYLIRYIPPDDSQTTYALMIADVTDNFQFQDLSDAYHVWTSAWIKPKSTQSENPLYRVLLNNTTTKDIELQNGSYMLMLGQNYKDVRYIVSTSVDVDNADPTPVFSAQTIPAGGSSYVWYAQELPSPSVGGWVGDSAVGFFHVSFTMCFNYAGEPENRIISLPAQAIKIE